MLPFSEAEAIPREAVVSSVASFLLVGTSKKMLKKIPDGRNDVFPLVSRFSTFRHIFCGCYIAAMDEIGDD